MPLKDEICSEITSLWNVSPAPLDFHVDLGRELGTLRNSGYPSSSLSSSCSISQESDPANIDLSATPATSDRMKLTTWNCSLVNNASQPVEESLANVRALSHARLIVDKYKRVVVV